MLLQYATWMEAEAYLKRSNAIIMPIGSTEQHGPNGLIGTDALCAEVIARGIGEAANAFVGPTIGVGMAVHHMGFAGSMTLRPSTLIQVVHDYVLSLARHGFRRFFFLNGHGGNIATLNAAFYEVYAAAEGALGRAATDEPVRCKLMNWWDSPQVGVVARELFGDNDGTHATASEVAVTQWAFPETIKRAEFDPPRAPAGGFYGPANFRARYPDGRIGSNPGLASPEKGKRLYDAAVPDLTRLFQDFAKEA